MKLGNSDWKFDEKVTEVFDEHVEKSIPFYSEIHSLVGDLSGWFLKDNTNIYDIGTSTGKVIQSLLQQYPNKSVYYVGLDNSLDMVAKTKKFFEQKRNVLITLADVTRDFEFSNASLITSILTMQFIDDKDRQDIIDRVYKGLNKGSAFIFVEKVVGNDARFNQMWVDMHHDLKIRKGLSEKDVIDKARSIRGVMRPYTVDENIDMLMNSGFKNIDIFFKWGNFAGFIAVK